MVVKQISSLVANFGDHHLHYRVVVCLLFLTSRKFLEVLGSGIVSCSVFCHYISLFVHNHVKQEVLYCVVDTGYGLGRSLHSGVCSTRPGSGTSLLLYLSLTSVIVIEYTKEGLKH